MSTIAPATARELAERVRGEGHAFVDAPVTGSSPKAKTGTLTIMCGGEDADIERRMPIPAAPEQALNRDTPFLPAPTREGETGRSGSFRKV